MLVGHSPAAATLRARADHRAGPATRKAAGFGDTGATRVGHPARVLIDDKRARARRDRRRAAAFHVESPTSATASRSRRLDDLRELAPGRRRPRVMGNALQPIVLRGVTLAAQPRDLPRPAAAVLARRRWRTDRRARSSRATSSANADRRQRPSNCTGSATRATDGGGNVESQADCGLAAAAARTRIRSCAARTRSPATVLLDPARPAPPSTSPPAERERSTSAASRGRRGRVRCRRVRVRAGPGRRRRPRRRRRHRSRPRRPPTATATPRRRRRCQPHRRRRERRRAGSWCRRPGSEPLRRARRRSGHPGWARPSTRATARSS